MVLAGLSAKKKIIETANNIKLEYQSLKKKLNILRLKYFKKFFTKCMFLWSKVPKKNNTHKITEYNYAQITENYI